MIKIGIDIGHGGSDPGAVSKATGMQERKVNLNVGLKLKDLLEKAGFLVVMDRVTDIDVSFPQRGRIINEAKVDFAISIHHNAGGGHGYEVIHNLKKAKSKDVAMLIAAEFKKLNQTQHSVYAKESLTQPGNDYYGIMKAITAPMVITEYAYMDTDDVKDIDTLAEQWGEAQAITSALKKYFKL